MNLRLAHLPYDNPSNDLSEKDYYSGGMVMPGRNFNSSQYRFGFNSGGERDDEISGEGNHYTTDWRELDVRLGGRWWSPDRIVKSWESPYAGFANNPIYYSDPSGLNPDCADCGFESGQGTEHTPIELPEVVVTPDGVNSNNTTVGNVTGTTGGTLGGMTLDFIYRDRVDYRNTYYNPKVQEAKNLWKAGQMSDGAYSMYRYHAQKATKMQYSSSISKLMGEIPPTGKPLWQQKALAEGVASGKPIPSGAGTTRGLTTKISTQTSMKVIGHNLVVVSAGMSIYTVATADNKVKAIATEAGGWAGAWGGATMGASIGAAIGGPFAPITGGIGGIIGGGIGYFVGSEVGEAVYKTVEE